MVWYQDLCLHRPDLTANLTSFPDHSLFLKHLSLIAWEFKLTFCSSLQIMQFLISNDRFKSAWPPVFRQVKYALCSILQLYLFQIRFPLLTENGISETFTKAIISLEISIVFMKGGVLSINATLFFVIIKLFITLRFLWAVILCLGCKRVFLIDSKIFLISMFTILVGIVVWLIDSVANRIYCSSLIEYSSLL